MSSYLFSIMAQSGAGSDWNWFLIFIIFVIVLAIALIIQARFSKQDTAEFEHHEAAAHHDEVEFAPAAVATPEPKSESKVEPEAESEVASLPEETTGMPDETHKSFSEPDDLKKLEGIGPKVASLLNENGITTFAQLADTPVEILEEILNVNKLQMIHPGSWPKQAKLAADGDIDGLKTLQDELQGGR